MAASDHYSAIQKLYIAYFNRPADVLGLQYWSGVVEANGGSVEAIANAFSGSQEYKTEYGGKSSMEVVRTIYQNLFGREPELAGLVYWSNHLDNGTLKIGNIVYTVMQSALGSDAAVIENKLAAAIAFTTNLDTVAEISAYSGDGAATVGRKFLSGITADAPSTSALDSAIGKAIGELLGTTKETDTGSSTPTPVFSAALAASTVNFTNPGTAISVSKSGDDYTFTSTGGIAGTATITTTGLSGIVVPTGTTLTVSQALTASVTFSGAGTVKISDGGPISASFVVQMDGGVLGLLDASAYTDLMGTMAELTTVLITNQGTSGNKIKTASNVNVQVNSLTADANDLKAIEAATTGFVGAASVQTLTGSTADAKLLLVTNNGSSGDKISTATNLIVNLSDTGAVAAADLNDINAATTGLVSSSTITGISGTAANVKTALEASTVGTALSLTGLNAIALSDNVSAGDLDSVTFANNATIALANVAGNALTIVDGSLGAGQVLTVNGSALTSAHSLTFNGSAETNGTFVVTGGAGGDTITGGAGNDTITGGAGADTLTGGGGGDVFIYRDVSDSNISSMDTIFDFVGGVGNDTIDLTGFSAAFTSLRDVTAGVSITMPVDLVAAVTAATALTNVGEVAYFFYDSGTYIVGETASGNLTIKLTGIISLVNTDIVM